MPINPAQVKSLRSKFEKQGAVYAEFDDKDAHEKLHGKPAPFQYGDVDDEEEEEEAEADDGEDESAEVDVDGDASDSDPEEADRVLNGADDGLSAEELAAAEAELIAQAESERLAKHERKMQKKAAKQEAAKEKQAHSLAINFAKRLAHNDKKVRDQTIKTLRRWLLRREHMDYRDLMKIWKGLFYCFWMSDKVPVQQQLADALSDLLLPPLDFDRSLLFFSTFLITCGREWTAIDQLRMDKFMTLVRRFMQKMFQTLAAEGWKDEQVKAVTEELLVEHALGHNTSCRGFAFHLMDVFLAEIERVSAATPSKAITFEALNTLLTPFYHILARSRDQTVVDRTKKEVFDTLRDICATPLPQEPEAEEPKPKKKEQPKKNKNTKKSKKVPQEDEEDEDMEISEEEDEEEEEQTPAVEGVAADFPALHQVLDGQAGAISEILFTLATDPEILPRSRKLLYSYRAEFDEIQRLAEEEDEEEEEVDVSEAAAAAAAALAATQLPTRKRKRGENDGEQQQQQPPNSRKETSKKKNRRQRLAEKRRKKEALLGAEPGRQFAEQQQGDEEEEGEEYDEEGMEMDEDEDGDDEQMDFDEEELDDIDMDASDLDDDEDQFGGAEAEEDDMIALKPKLSKKEQKKLEAALQAKQAAAAAAAAADKNNKKNSKKKIVPEVVEAEPEEQKEEEEEPQPKKKKQKISTAPPQPAEPVSSKKDSKKKHAAAPTPAQPEPTPVSAPAPASPKQKSQSPLITPTKAPAQSNGFSTPAHSQSTIKPALKTGDVPPSSSKKSVKIMLSQNKVKQFNKWARDSVTTDTPSLLAKPSPKSAIKAESIEFFLKHNKNGRELAARQSKLTLNLSAAAGEKRTPPVSPSRQKASDFF